MNSNSTAIVIGRPVRETPESPIPKKPRGRPKKMPGDLSSTSQARNRRAHQNNTDYSKPSKLVLVTDNSRLSIELGKTPRDRSFLSPADSKKSDIIHDRVNKAVEDKIRFYASQKMSRKRLEAIYGVEAVRAVLGG